MDIKVIIPNNFLAERRYIISCIFDFFWGIKYTLEISAEHTSFYIIQYHNQALAIPDVFFAQNTNYWLTTEWNPAYPFQNLDTRDYGWEHLCKDRFLPDLFPPKNNPLPSSDLEFHLLNLDIFGTAFFMLSRYEEFVSPRTDIHGRFPFNASITSNENLVDRPIVNEYLEILWTCISSLAPNLERKSRKFRINLSHDVDRPNFAHSNNKSVKVYDLEPLAHYSKLLDFAEEHNLQSAFYFLSAVTEPKLDADYTLDDKEIEMLLKLINANGHEIGFHPSYHTFEDPDQTMREWQLLNEKCDQLKITQKTWGGRQHYLRFKTPTTWRNWESAGLDYDSTLGFAEHPGFRCGICYDFPVFDLQKSEPLKLLERPLVWMDVSLLSEIYMGFQVGSDKALSYSLGIKELCKKYNGDFNLLYHDNYLLEPSHFLFLENIIA